MSGMFIEQNDRKLFIACGFCGVKILPVIGYKKHSRHILGVHTNIITAVNTTASSLKYVAWKKV